MFDKQTTKNVYSKQAITKFIKKNYILLKYNIELAMTKMSVNYSSPVYDD